MKEDNFEARIHAPGKPKRVKCKRCEELQAENKDLKEDYQIVKRRLKIALEALKDGGECFIDLDRALKELEGE